MKVDRSYYETEIAKILKELENQDIRIADYYRAKTIEALLDIDNPENLKKIYSFVSAFP